MANIVKKLARRILVRPLHKPDLDVPYLMLGDKHADFPLLRDTKSGSLVYSFGVGENISFERTAIDTFDCAIHAFDPTPKSISWLNSQTLPEKFKFHQIGIGGHDGEVEFFEPENPNYVSFSISPDPSRDGAAAVHSKVMRLQSIISHLKTGVPDVVRMNVEGFEYPFVEDFVRGDVRPRQLIIEFHHGMYGIEKQRTMEAVKTLKEIGYKIFFVSDHTRDYGFVYQS